MTDGREGQGDAVKWIIMVLLMVICILMVICYALLVVASDADDRAEEFWKEWEDE